MEHKEKMAALLLGSGVVLAIIFRQYLRDRVIAFVYRNNSKEEKTDVKLTISPPITEKKEEISNQEQQQDKR